MSTEKFIKREKMSINDSGTGVGIRLDGNHGGISNDGFKFIDPTDGWSQSSERDNAPRNSNAFLSKGWGGV